MPETRETEPALDPEDWAYFLSGGVRKHTLQDAVECAERGRRDLTPRALAALALHGERYGFTHGDLDVIQSGVLALREANCPLCAEELAMVADRLRALLPPE